MNSSNFYTILAKYLSHCVCKCKSHNVSERKIANTSPTTVVYRIKIFLLFSSPRIPLLFCLHFGKLRQERFRFNHIGLFIPRATFVLMDISIFPSSPLPLLPLLPPFNYVTSPFFSRIRTFQLEVALSIHGIITISITLSISHHLFVNS